MHVTDRRQTDDRRHQTDGRQHIANVNVSSRSLKMGRKFGEGLRRQLLGAVPLWGRGAGRDLTQCVLAEAYLHAKFHLNPSNRLATVVHQR